MGADYSLRIWLDPGKMARYGLIPDDITKVLDEQNLEAPTGTLGAESEIHSSMCSNTVAVMNLNRIMRIWSSNRFLVAKS